MSEDNKDDNIKNENGSDADNQSEVDQNNTTEEINQSSADQNHENQPGVENIQSSDENSETNLTQNRNINKEPENKNEHQVIIKKTVDYIYM